MAKMFGPNVLVGTLGHGVAAGPQDVQAIRPNPKPNKVRIQSNVLALEPDLSWSGKLPNIALNQL